MYLLKRSSPSFLVLLALCLSCQLLLVSLVNASSLDYFIGQNDVLKITVYDHPDLETKVRVNGNGEILMPLLGHVDVDGLTIAEVSNKLSTLLADGYIINPQVNAFVEEYGSKKAVILGMVVKPGLYELTGQTTLLELISLAGGLAEDSGITATVKSTNSTGKTDIAIIDLRALMEGGDISQNIRINNRDNVYVSKAGMCFVTGEVKNPDTYKIDEDTTVIKAITLAAGFTGKAAKGSVRIIRIVDGVKIVLKNVDLDSAVSPDDVIVVPESFF
ncbi:MAG: SLBB domain-containing protein [Desulfobulbaceae bacterium]|jgi:polysaccharide export outer membrane protein|nr:SLBB domain-containing protein [Desulfobulbaceae bacterium]